MQRGCCWEQVAVLGPGMVLQERRARAAVKHSHLPAPGSLGTSSKLFSRPQVEFCSLKTRPNSFQWNFYLHPWVINDWHLFQMCSSTEGRTPARWQQCLSQGELRLNFMPGFERIAWPAEDQPCLLPRHNMLATDCNVFRAKTHVEDTLRHIYRKHICIYTDSHVFCTRQCSF